MCSRLFGVASAASPANLPSHFVDSLRVLFDILDTSRTGLIAIEQITEKWQSLPKANLPPGFLECLRRVMPVDGLLTFERFMAGFRLALFNRQSGARLQRVRSEGKLDEAGLKAPAMGINSLLVDHKRRYHATGNSHHQHQQHAHALRALNVSHSTLLNQNSSSPLTLQMSDDNYGVMLNRRPASAGANRRLDEPMLVNGASNYSVIMRDKKPNPTSAPNSTGTNSSTASSVSNPQQQHQMPTKSIRAPPPPQMQQNSNNYAAVVKSPKTIANSGAMTNRFRPVSMTSSGSGSCSSGMGEVRWRDSTRLSSSNSPPDSFQRQPYAEELQPQVVGF